MLKDGRFTEKIEVGVPDDRGYLRLIEKHLSGRVLGAHRFGSILSAKPPKVVALFRAFARLVRQCGPVSVIPEKTRIAFQARMSFAAVSLRKERIVGHVVLARRLECARFTKVESISPRNHIHHFSLTSPEELDDEVLSWLREAYGVGMQGHLDRKPGSR